VGLFVRLLVCFGSARRTVFVDAAQGVLFLLMQRKAYCFFVAGCYSGEGCVVRFCVRVCADVFWVFV
jgi:hypothetical protein